MGSGNCNRRKGPWTIWRPLVTGRRMLRTIFASRTAMCNPELLELQDLALRVSLAVTWLTVYRQLHIPVRIVWAQRRVCTNLEPAVIRQPGHRACRRQPSQGKSIPPVGRNGGSRREPSQHALSAVAVAAKAYSARRAEWRPQALAVAKCLNP